MQDIDRNKIIELAISNAEILWKIKKSKALVVGPWQEAKKDYYEICGGLWRLAPNGKEVVTIYKSSKLLLPEEYKYHNWHGDADDEYYFDEEAFEKDMIIYEQTKLFWKEWTYLFDTCGYYADSKESAQELADKALLEKGYLLYNGE